MTEGRGQNSPKDEDMFSTSPSDFPFSPSLDNDDLGSPLELDSDPEPHVLNENSFSDTPDQNYPLTEDTSDPHSLSKVSNLLKRPEPYRPDRYTKALSFFSSPYTPAVFAFVEGQSLGLSYLIDPEATKTFATALPSTNSSKEFFGSFDTALTVYLTALTAVILIACIAFYLKNRSEVHEPEEQFVEGGGDLNLV